MDFSKYAFTKTFAHTASIDFSAYREASSWLTLHGYRICAMNGQSPVGILPSDVLIGDWHGNAMSDDYRHGDVTIYLNYTP